MAGADVEAELLEGVGEGGLIEEGVGGVGEPALEQVLVDQGVQLVGPQDHRHARIYIMATQPLIDRLALK